jgi:hypothetical protein
VCKHDEIIGCVKADVLSTVYANLILF